MGKFALFLMCFGALGLATSYSQAKDIDYLAIAGSKAAEKMAALFTQVPDTLTPVIQEQGTTLVYIAGEMSRYLIIDSADCDVICQENLYNIREVRFSKGRQMKRLQLAWLVN